MRGGGSSNLALERLGQTDKGRIHHVEKLTLHVKLYSCKKPLLYLAWCMRHRCSLQSPKKNAARRQKTSKDSQCKVQSAISYFPAICFCGAGIMSNIPTFKFAFVFFMVTSSWTLLSILTAVASWTQLTW